MLVTADGISSRFFSTRVAVTSIGSSVMTWADTLVQASENAIPKKNSFFTIGLITCLVLLFFSEF